MALEYFCMSLKKHIYHQLGSSSFVVAENLLCGVGVKDWFSHYNSEGQIGCLVVGDSLNQNLLELENKTEGRHDSDCVLAPWKRHMLEVTWVLWQVVEVPWFPGVDLHMTGLVLVSAVSRSWMEEVQMEGEVEGSEGTSSTC